MSMDKPVSPDGHGPKPLAFFWEEVERLPALCFRLTSGRHWARIGWTDTVGQAVKPAGADVMNFLYNKESGSIGPFDGRVSLRFPRGQKDPGRFLANVADGLVMTQRVPVVDLNGRPLTPCTPEKAEQNLKDGLAIMIDGVLRLNYRPLAYRRIYRLVRERDGFICAWCGGVGSTLDHVLPLCWGGRTHLNNCVIACRSCNHSRNNALPSQFVAWTGFHPTHPVIRYVLSHEDELVGRAEESLKMRPISTCLSKEEAQVWVSCHQGDGEPLRPHPPTEPFSRLRGDNRFRELFLP